MEPVSRAAGATPRRGALTRLLAAWNGGDQEALRRLLPLVYDELRQVARKTLARERPGATLQPTALVHEAFFKLTESAGMTFTDRAHFFAVAARAMRQVLVDRARRRGAAKRQGGPGHDLVAAEAVALPRSVDVLALDRALERLGRLDPEEARLVELRFFGGLTVEEAAAVVGRSVATLNREWKHAQAWLQRELEGGPGPLGTAP